jgi:hypothetical protein
MNHPKPLGMRSDLSGKMFAGVGPGLIRNLPPPFPNGIPRSRPDHSDFGLGKGFYTFSKAFHSLEIEFHTGRTRKEKNIGNRQGLRRNLLNPKGRIENHFGSMMQQRGRK